jgi:ACS family hexuronate transporter-like MFS transporter
VKPGARAIGNLRWWIGGALFASTVINYIDRQTLSVLAPHLKSEFRWTNSDFALIVISFRIAYAIGQTVAGRLLDWLGTRRGLLIGVLWYSAAAMMTSLAGGLRSFAFFRFLLGSGEAANWPGATKAVAEWFPKGERGLAVALFDSGSAIGGAVAPAMVVWLYAHFGNWRPVFIVTGALGLAWVLLWSRLYHPPETHPRISPEERAMILAAREQERAEEVAGGDEKIAWSRLLSMRQTWGIILGRGLTDPVWFFITDWFAIYLVAKGFAVTDTLVGFWVPFLAADAGNFAGGGLSSWLVRRGWSAVRARKLVIAVCGVGMALIAGAAFTSSLPLLVSFFAASTFCYAAWSTMALALPTDLYPSHSVATVSGMGGTGAGTGTIISTYLIGWSADRYSFEPVLVGASLIPLVATALVLLLIRQRRPRSVI